MQFLHAFLASDPWLQRQSPGFPLQCPIGAEFRRHFLSVTGVVLSSEELGALLMPADSARLPHIVKGQPCHAGTGLAAVYTLTDVPMALAGT